MGKKYGEHKNVEELVKIASGYSGILTIITGLMALIAYFGISFFAGFPFNQVLNSVAVQVNCPPSKVANTSIAHFSCVYNWILHIFLKN